MIKWNKGGGLEADLASRPLIPLCFLAASRLRSPRLWRQQCQRGGRWKKRCPFLPGFGCTLEAAMVFAFLLPLFFFFLLSCLIYFFITFQFASLVNHYRFVSVSGTASAEQPHELKLAHVCRFGATGQIMGRTHFCSSGWWVKDGMRGRSWNFLLLPPSLCLHLLVLWETENLASIATEGLRQSFLLPAHKWELTLI